MAAAFAFLLDDDLGQHAAGDVVAGLGVIDDEVAAVAHHVGQRVERDVAGAFRIVEPPVGVFLHHHGRRCGGWRCSRRDIGHRRTPVNVTRRRNIACRRVEGLTLHCNPVKRCDAPQFPCRPDRPIPVRLQAGLAVWTAPRDDSPDEGKQADLAALARDWIALVESELAAMDDGPRGAGDLDRTAGAVDAAASMAALRGAGMTPAPGRAAPRPAAGGAAPDAGDAEARAPRSPRRRA